MDWVHCNNCFSIPDRDRSFFLTSCGHIYCKNCEGECARGLCRLCGNQCSLMPLSSSMKPDVQVYFTDPSVLLKKKLKEVQQVAVFQKNHHDRLMAYYRKQHGKFCQMREDFKKILKTVKEIDSARAKLQKENEALKKHVRMSSSNKPLADFSQSSMQSHKAQAFLPSFGSYENTPPSYSHMNPVFSKFFGKMDSAGSSSSKSCMPDRISVFSPPVNGKIGGIPGTPSPCSAFRNMNLTSAHLGDAMENRDCSPGSTPESSQESVIGSSSRCARQGDNDPSSPLDSWNPRNSQANKAFLYRKDQRKVVVHPYSPDD